MAKAKKALMENKNEKVELALELRKKMIGKIIKSSNDTYGEGYTNILSSENIRSIVRNTITTGAPSLDAILARDSSGKCGAPVGRIIGISGPEASGKTTLGVALLTQTQRMGGVARLIETEHAFDPSYSKKLGLNIDELLISQPDYLEQALDMILIDIEKFKEAREEYVSETGEEWTIPMTILFDSIAGSPAKAEWEAGSFETNQALGLHARQLSKFFRKIANIVSKENICLICTNQQKTDTKITYGDSSAEIGGKALKFHASIRMKISRREFIYNNQTEKIAIGIRSTIKTVKNKVMPPYKEVIIPIYFNKGINYAESMLDLLIESNMLKKSKNTFEFSRTIGGKLVEFSGVKAKAKKWITDISESPKLKRHLERAVYDEIFKDAD